MTEIEKKLIRKARKMHARIYPCPTRKEFENSFTQEKDRIYFWYNTEDQSTHVIGAKVTNR